MMPRFLSGQTRPTCGTTRPTCGTTRPRQSNITYPTPTMLLYFIDAILAEYVFLTKAD